MTYKTYYNLKQEINHHSIEHNKKTDRNIVGFYSNFLNVKNESVSINSFDENNLIKIIHELNPSKGLDLILHACEGSISSTEAIIDYLHNYFKRDIRVIIPQITRGEGTTLACSSKEILMGDYSTLMSADTKINGLYAYNVINEFEIAKKEISENPNVENFWKILLKKYPENRLEECKKAVESSKILLKKSLNLSMFENNQLNHIDNIVSELIHCNSENTPSLNLNPVKYEEIGLNIKNLNEDNTPQDIVLSLHFACIDYFDNENNSKLFFNQNGDFITS